MNKDTKTRIIIIGVIATLIVLVGSFTYAFFVANPTVEKFASDITTGTMRMRFADNDNSIKANINHGDSITKKFIIENTGTLDTYASIYLEELINTYTKGSFSYDLESSE